MKRSCNWITKGFAILLSTTMLMSMLPANTASASKRNYNPVDVATLTSSVNTTVEDVTNEVDTKYELTKASIDELTKNLVAFYGETSVEYALIDHGEIVLSGSNGYANKETKTAPVSSTMYGIGSISKIYTTVAVMQLVEQGLVDLDQPVVQYIPEFTMADERYEKITVRMLLNHSSGLMGSTMNNSILFGDNDQTGTDSLLEYLKTQRLKADPGTIYVYCNDGFTLAELLVEHVTGISFTNYLHKNIISPLGLKNTNTPAEYFVTRKLARIYTEQGKRLPKESISNIGAGGIYSTAEEMCYFAETFMKNSNGLLKDSSVQAMSNAEYRNGIHMEDPDAVFTFGLGWDNVSLSAFSNLGIKALEKGGDTAYYHSSMIVLPEENIAIAILSVGGVSTYNKKVAEETLLTYLEETSQIHQTKEEQSSEVAPTLAVQDMPKEYKEYSGYYANNFFVCQVEFSGNEMKYTNLINGSTATLTYIGDGWFQYNNGPFWMRVVKESNGKIYIYDKETSTLPKLGTITTGLYLAQKLEDYEVSESALNAWLGRSHKEYLLVSEKYSSYVYGAGLMLLSLPTEEDLILDKYLGMMKVVDETHLTMDLQIPMNYGRDLVEYSVVEADGIEYMKQNEYVFVDKESVPSLQTKGTLTVNISENGYAKYYIIPEECEGKNIQVTVPNHATFVVYNAQGMVIRNSYFDQKKKATLPKGGYLVFVGNVGAEFKLSFVD